MYKNIKVEAEHNELILENSHGDKVIIPANKRNWVKQKLSEGCHSCIDSLVETLPVASQYAQDGSVYPPNKKVKVNQDNQIKEYDINSNEYKDLYNSGKLMSYDKNTDTYIATPLKEATITAEAPQWLKDKRNLEKQYSKDWYIDNNLPKFSRSMGVSSDNMGGNQKGYDEYINNKLAESILKRNPNFDKNYKNDRLKTLSNYSQKELEIIKNSNLSYKIEPSIWSKFEQGLLSVGNAGSPVTFKNENLTQEEAKKEDNPLNILQPLNIPSKIVQSAYKKDYSLKNALKGKQNNAGIVEDIITDPLNLAGVGLAGKLSKVNKVIDATKAGSKVLNKLDDAVNNINRIKFDDFKNDNEFFRVIVGDEAFDDIVQTQKIRTKQPSSVKNTPPNTINLDRRGSTAFPSFSKGSPSLSYANDNPNHYIIRTADESIKPSTSGRHGKGTTMFPTDKSGKHLTELDASKVQVYKHVGNGEYELVNTAKPIISSVDDVVKNASLIPNWTVPKIKSVEEIDKLDNLHPVFKTFDKDTWKEIAQKKGNEYFLDRFNKQLVNVTNDLNSYENLAINISDYPEIIEGKKWSEDFVKSSEWKQRVKNANPDLTEEQINNLQKSTLLSMPSNMKTFIKNQASKNSFHGGQFTYDDLVHGRNVAFRYFTPEEVLDHPLHFKSLASHEFGHSQSTMRKLPNDKTWHQPLEESGDMMKTNDIYKGDRYVELSEEKRARSIPSYMFAKENNLLENGEFTEKTYDILKNMAEKDLKSVPNDFNSILSWYDKKSAINYLNKFYATIPFYLYLQSQNQNQNKSEQ